MLDKYIDYLIKYLLLVWILGNELLPFGIARYRNNGEFRICEVTALTYGTLDLSALKDSLEKYIGEQRKALPPRAACFYVFDLKHFRHGANTFLYISLYY